MNVRIESFFRLCQFVNHAKGKGPLPTFTKATDPFSQLVIHLFEPHRKCTCDTISALFPQILFETEGLAVGALLLGRVDLMGTDLDFIQRTVILTAAMVGALAHGAGDALVGIVVLIHDANLLFQNGLSLPRDNQIIHCYISQKGAGK